MFLLMRYILLIIMLLVCGDVYSDEYYIGKWVWTVDSLQDDLGGDAGTMEYWKAPRASKLTGVIDLRSIPQQSLKGGTPEGYAIFSYSELVTHARLHYLGDNLDIELPPVRRNAIKDRLGITSFTALSMKDILWEILTTKADPTGVTRVKPIMPRSDRKMKLRLGTRGVIKEIVLKPYESKEWDIVLATLHNDYRRMLRTESHIMVAKALDYWEDQYGIHYTAFIPNDSIQLASLPHETTVTSGFACSNDASLDCEGVSWTDLEGDFQIVSSKARPLTSGARNTSRADTDLSSSNHYSEGVDRASSSSGRSNGVVARLDSSGDITYYLAECLNTGTDVWRTYKAVVGSFTALGTNTEATCASGDDIKIEVNGSTIKRYKNSVEDDSTTDTSITVGLRAGLSSYSNLDGTDTWTAEDLTAEASTGTSTKFFN